MRIVRNLIAALRGDMSMWLFLGGRREVVFDYCKEGEGVLSVNEGGRWATYYRGPGMRRLWVGDPLPIDRELIR